MPCRSPGPARPVRAVPRQQPAMQGEGEAAAANIRLILRPAPPPPGPRETLPRPPGSSPEPGLGLARPVRPREGGGEAGPRPRSRPPPASLPHPPAVESTGRRRQGPRHRPPDVNPAPHRDGRGTARSQPGQREETRHETGVAAGRVNVLSWRKIEELPVWAGLPLRGHGERTKISP